MAGRPTDVLLDPNLYATTAPYDLLAAAAWGYASPDHRWLRAILDRPAEAVPDLVRFGMERREEDPVPLEGDVVAMLRHLADPRGLPFLLECLRRHPEDVEDDVLDAFCRLRETAVDPLLGLYHELGPETGGEVAFVLAALRVRDSRILDLLLDRLTVDPGDTAFLLGMYGDPAAKPRLEKAVEELAGTSHPSAWEEREFRYAISRLETPEPPVMLQAYDIWADYPEYEPPRFGILSEEDTLQFLGSPDAGYRASAAGSLGASGVSDAAKARLLDLAGSDPEPEVRARCWKTLGGSLEDSAVLEAMRTRLVDPAAPLVERCGALVGLAGDSDDPAVRSRIVEFYDLPEARARALEAMWRSFDRGFAEFFPKHLDDPDMEIRREAIAGVGYLGIGSKAAKLREFFDQEEFRADALFAYALSVPGEVTRFRMRQLFAKIDDLADGLSNVEEQLVKAALDDRLALHGLEPVFQTAEQEAEEGEQTAAPSLPAKAGRNDPCPCGSGKKYKKCCGG